MRAWIESFGLARITRCQRGATAVEYGLILALIVLAMIAGLSNLATKTVGQLNNVATEVRTH